MKLSKEQIEELYKFTRKHFVVHYDLQTELVDHLANGIEAQWIQNLNLTFKETLKIEFKKFGITGFEEVITKRKNAMNKRYYKIILRFYKEYFRLPKLLLTLVAILGLTTIIYFLPENYKIEFLSGLFIATAMVIMIIHFRKRRNYDFEMVKLGKKWMLKDIIYGIGDGAQVFNLFGIILNSGFISNELLRESIALHFSLSTVYVCMILLHYTTMFIIPQKAEELLLETYPEYKIS